MTAGLPRLLGGGAAMLGTWTVAYPVAAQPPAPPLPQVQRLADEVTARFNACDIARYGDAFDDAVQVYENGKPVATSRAAWLALQQVRCRSQEARVRAVNLSFDSVLVLDDVVEPRTSKPDQVWECCSYARAAIYKLRTGDYRIVEVRFLINAPGYWRPDRR